MLAFPRLSPKEFPVRERPVPVKSFIVSPPIEMAPEVMVRPAELARPAIDMPPANVEVAVLVAMKYGAAIFVPASIPPEKVEVAVEVATKYELLK